MGANADDDLERFVAAQDGVWPEPLRELAAGAKRSHWMWFVFPQLRGLGHSEMSRYYGMASLDEARAYWKHASLGPRLREVCAALEALPASRSALAIFGSIDAMKLRSCLTLFERAVPDEPLFARLIERCWSGERDGQTLRLLDGAR